MPQKTKAKKPSANPRKRKWLRRLFKLALLGMLASVIALAWYTYDLPDIRTLEDAERKPSITMVTKDGELLTTYGDLYGTTITLDKVPKYVPQAVLAIEDHRSGATLRHHRRTTRADTSRSDRRSRHRAVA